ncbi:holin family protein [Alphaproteobacteria bacterium]|nr:holin family protein [Alphaproteobacteria bacterium]
MNLLGRKAIDPVRLVSNLLDTLFTSDEERLDKKAVLARIVSQPNVVQSEIGKIEATHKSIFVAGWRPFIGWVCGAALAYNFIIRELVIWSLAISDKDILPPPALQMEVLTTILYALLGLGGLRTFEKLRGRAL